jgi:hypothetical protein
MNKKETIIGVTHRLCHRCGKKKPVFVELFMPPDVCEHANFEGVVYLCIDCFALLCNVPHHRARLEDVETLLDRTSSGR